MVDETGGRLRGYSHDVTNIGRIFMNESRKQFLAWVRTVVIKLGTQLLSDAERRLDAKRRSVPLCMAERDWLGLERSMGT